MRVLSFMLSLLLFWTFNLSLPRLELKELGQLLGTPRAYALELAGSNNPPLNTDLSEPDTDLKFSWARLAGREEAVYLNIPSNQLSQKIVLPGDPSPLILAKYDPSTSSGQIAIMRMRQVGASIQAEILQIAPRNFQHHFGSHLYNFAMLDWNINNDPACIYSEKALRDDDPPTVNNDEIRRKFADYDLGLTLIKPLFVLAGEQEKINRSNYYWHQRLNSDPCWFKWGLKDFDNGDENFNNVSEAGFFRIVALAMHIHKAAASITAKPEIRTQQTKKTKKSFAKKKVTITVRYFLRPNWIVGTPSITGTYSDFIINPTYDRNTNYAFVGVKGNHSFPVDETLVYEYKKSVSGFTGLFVFVAIVVIAALTGGAFGAAGLSLFGTLESAMIGAAAGAVGGLVAVGGSPTLNTTAKITPFSDSSYSLDASSSMTGHAREVAKRTFSNWVSPAILNTPGGVQIFASKINIRKALACGGASRATDECPDLEMDSVGMDDPRFDQVYNEMFHFEHKDLQKYKYPFTTR